MQKDRPTIKQVASMAGVSTATVSRYLNKSREFTKEVQSKIQKAIDSLDYVPNENARSLKQQRTKVIGIIVPDMVVYSYILREIEQLLYEHGYSTIMANSAFDSQREEDLLLNLFRQRVDGIILASCGGNSNFIQSIQKQGIPIVLFDRYLSDLPNMPYVLEKGKECTRKIVEYALKQGHKNIAYIQGPSSEHVSAERFNEFLTILDENSISKTPRFYYPDVVHSEKMKEVCNDILDNINKISLVITTNGKQIKQFIMAAHARGFEIPKDISITGFGLEEYKTLFSSPITCIIQNHKAIGYECTKKLLDLISHKEKIGEKCIIEIESEFFIGKSIRDLK